MMSKPLVSILSITYNHEKYVAQALESFVMQQADFDYEVIIADDASPDNTQAVIQKYADKYPDIIKPILREKNLGMNPNFLDALSRAQGKYIALCEGDDYWTDPYKLQKQVDFLEGHQRYSAVFTNKYRQKGEMLTPHLFFKKRYTSKDILGKGHFGIQTIMFRKEVLESKILGHLRDNNVVGDLALIYSCSVYGKIKHLPVITAVYRITGKGVSTSKPKGFISDDYYRLHKALDFPSLNRLTRIQMKKLSGIVSHSIFSLKKNDKLIEDYVLRHEAYTLKKRILCYYYLLVAYYDKLFMKIYRVFYNILNR